jgi:hypothetical protein
MILRISVNLVKFCVSEVGEFWWSFFYFAWRKRGGAERGVVDGKDLTRFVSNQDHVLGFCSKYAYIMQLVTKVIRAPLPSQTESIS